MKFFLHEKLTFLNLQCYKYLQLNLILRTERESLEILRSVIVYVSIKKNSRSIYL